MRIGLVAPPFISVPPKKYGGTELFVAHLAEGLRRAGHDPVVYTVGDSTVRAERRWLFPHMEWPVQREQDIFYKDLRHSAWAVRDAAADCDIIHVQSATALSLSPLIPIPFVYTLHHAYDPELSRIYHDHPEVQYVAISDAQKNLEKMTQLETIHHGVDMSLYSSVGKKQPYLAFIGRIAPVKGVHVAIEVAQRCGIPLKIAGEIQPIYRAYYESEIKPHIDGKFIEYVGEADLAGKQELLGNARAMLFPILWDEPFGLVMIESMACGTPVLAFGRGSVPEVVKDGVSGYVCKDAGTMAARAASVEIPAALVRKYCERFFSVDVMTQRYVSLYGNVLRNAHSSEDSLELSLLDDAEGAAA